STWAATAHYMDESIDTGGIIEIGEFPIDSDSETAQSLEYKCRPVLFGLFKKTVSKAKRAKDRLPVSHNKGGRYISRNQMEAMKHVQDGDDVDRKIRAFWFPPYDGALVEINGDKYTLVNRDILESLADSASSSLFSPERKRKR
ncbi:MAG: formyl transferase, partial [Woeseiaceae bacterium]